MKSIFKTPELIAAHADIKKAIAPHEFDLKAQVIAYELGRYGKGQEYEFSGEHAGRTWTIRHGFPIGVFIHVDGETVLHQNTSFHEFEVYTFRQWPGRDWIPELESLYLLAMKRRQEKAIAAEKAERERFAQTFGPIA